MFRTPPPAPSSERRGEERGGDGGILLRLTPRNPTSSLPFPARAGKAKEVAPGAQHFNWAEPLSLASLDSSPLKRGAISPAGGFKGLPFLRFLYKLHKL